MTEVDQGAAPSVATGSVSQQSAGTPAPQEKMLRQSEVDQLVGTIKHQAYQKGYDSARNEWQQQSQGQNQQPQTQHVDIETQRKLIAEELQKAKAQEQEDRQRSEAEAYGRKVMTELAGKISDAQQRIPDFDAVTSQIDFTQLNDILELSNHVENSGDVLYELAKNPSKIGSLRGLPPSVARVEMKRLSDSIKANEHAGNKRLPNDPLQKIEPSNVGVANSNPSLKDWKQKYKGRI